MRPFARPPFAMAFAVALTVACHPKATRQPIDAGAHEGKGAESDAGDAAPTPSRQTATVTPDDALPPFTSDELTIRAKHLLEAIAKDDGDLAADMLFPRDAYLIVKDVPDPGKNWDSKMLAAFRTQVHALHKRTKGVDRAVFTGFDLGQPASEALPKKKDLKKMLWRSKRSRLSFTIDGKPSHFDVIEMTGWQGSWYITKLK